MAAVLDDFRELLPARQTASTVRPQSRESIWKNT
jgi:hypothetical protein